MPGEFKPVSASVIPDIAIDWKGISGYWWLAGLSNFALLYFSTSAMFVTFVYAICKYQKVFTVLVLLLTASLGLWTWDVGHGMPLHWLWLAYGYVIPVTLILFSFFLLKAAISAGYLSRRYFMGVFCLWAVYIRTTSKFMWFERLGNVVVYTGSKPRNRVGRRVACSRSLSSIRTLLFNSSYNQRGDS